MIPTLTAVTAGNDLELAEYIALAKRQEFSGVEFSVQAVADLVEQTSFEAVAAIFDEAKVLPAVFPLPTEWRQSEEEFERGLEQLPKLARLAQDLSCTRCTTYVHPDSGEPVAEYAARSITRFQQIGQVLEDEGVRFGLEFLGPQHLRTKPDNVWFYDIPGALEVIGQVEDGAVIENMGLLVDSWHWYSSGGTMMDLAAIPVEKIVHVQINDAPDVPLQNLDDNVRQLPGESGVIDINGFLGTLNALGYDGPLSVECCNEALKQLPPDEAAGLAAAALAKVLSAANIEPVRLL